MKGVKEMNIIFDLGGVILLGKAKDVLDKLNIEEDEYNELIKFFDDWDRMDTTDETVEEKFNSYNFSDSIKSKYKGLNKELEKAEYEVNKEMISEEFANEMKEFNDMSSAEGIIVELGDVLSVVSY